MIYTGYFAKTKKYINDGYTTVSISGRAPEFYKGIQYKKLAPTWSIFKPWKDGEINNFEYTERFRKEVLGKLNVSEVREELESFGENVVLLCYEKAGDFCHRHIVADWLETSGVRVEEL